MRAVVKHFTRNGQQIEPYTGAPKEFPVRKTEGQRSYRLCQILPPIPQRFEWINEANIVEVRDRQQAPLAQAA